MAWEAWVVREVAVKVAVVMVLVVSDPVKGPVVKVAVRVEGFSPFVPAALVI